MSIIDMDNRDKDEVLRMREAEIEVMKAEFRRRVEGWRGGLASDCVAAVYDSMTAYLDSADKPAKYQPAVPPLIANEKRNLNYGSLYAGSLILLTKLDCCVSTAEEAITTLAVKECPECGTVWRPECSRSGLERTMRGDHLRQKEAQ